MNKSVHLTAEEVAFFELVARAAFANPFSNERTDVDRQITDLTGVTRREEQVDAVAKRVGAKVKELSLPHSSGTARRSARTASPWSGHRSDRISSWSTSAALIVRSNGRIA